MSDYHILETDTNLSVVRIAYHIDIPLEDNAIGTPLRLALVYYLGDSVGETIVPNLSVDFIDEYGLLFSGEKYEHREYYTFSNANLTTIQKRAELDARYTAFSISIVDDLRKILKYYRLDRNVP